MRGIQHRYRLSEDSAVCLRRCATHQTFAVWQESRVIKVTRGPLAPADTAADVRDTFARLFPLKLF